MLFAFLVNAIVETLVLHIWASIKNDVFCHVICISVFFPFFCFCFSRTRSKSLSDIPMVYPVREVSNGNPIYNKGQDAGLARGRSQDGERKRSVAAKDSEAQWQEASRF